MLRRVINTIVEPSTRSEHPAVLRFGEFEFDRSGHTLSKGGVRVHLQEKPFWLLAALLEKPNQIVTREELIKRLWPEDEYGEFDLGLNTAVRKVRHALGDSAPNPKWIQTVPRIGYRFLGPVQADLGPQPLEEDRPPPRRIPWAYVLLSLVAVLIAMAGLLRDPNSTSAETETIHPTLQPLTSLTGYESHPALSPDGTHAAFIWNGKDRDRDNVYVLSIADGALIQVTDDAARERHPVWSPDSNRLAFLRLTSTGAGLHLTTLEDPQDEQLLATVNIGGEGRSYGLDWSADGRFFALQNMETTDGRRGIFVVSAATGAMHRVTAAPAAYFADCWPSFSSDGRWVAFARGRTSHAIYVQELDETGWPVGQAVRATPESYFIRGVDWAPDDRHVIFAGVTTGGRMELRSVDVISKSVSLVLDGVGAELSMVAHRQSDGATLIAFVRETDDSDLFRIPGAAARLEGAPYPAPERFVSSTRYEHGPRFSPDGRKLAFVSYRSGTPELWVSDSDGSNLLRLTDFRGRGGASVGSPRWSMDNRRVAFEAGVDGNQDLFVVDSSGVSEPERLTATPANEVRASFSRDGRWLYFTSDGVERPEIWKMSSTGGEPVRLTFHRGLDPFESADGRWIYFAKKYGQFGAKGIYRIPVEGGEEEQVLEEGRVGHWALSDSGLYLYRPATDDAPPALDYYPHGSSTPRTLVEFAKTSKFGGANALTVTPDDRWVVFVQKAEPAADLALATLR